MRRIIGIGFATVLLPALLTGLALAQPISRPTGLTAGSVAAIPSENCQLVISAPDMNYGTLTRNALRDTVGFPGLSLGNRQMVIHVSCATPVKMGIRFRGPSIGADYVFGQHGKVTMQLGDPQLDGHRVLVGAANTAGMMPVAPASSARFVPGLVLVPVENGVPVVGSSFSATIEVEPVLPPDEVRVRSRTSLEMQGTFEVVWR